MTTLLVASGVGKQYPAAGIVRRNRPRKWSLRGVDLVVQPGEIVAVIGRNGAGKSTLLKLAAGVTRPSEGSLRRTHRVAPLIEVGAGFHPELTGRQNVGLNARLLGMSKPQVRDRFEEIVAFSGLAEVVDDPVKTYSSGMYMRLGFAVAVHTSPELLLVDEVLAVGDLPFQVKCLDRIRELRDAGTGILFVSHNLAAVQSLATRALLLDAGVAKAEGDVREVVGKYHELLALGGREGVLGEEAAEARAVCVVKADVADEAGITPALWNPGARAVVCLHVEAAADVGPSVLGATLHKEGAGMVGSWLGHEAPRVPAMKAGERQTVELAISLHVTAGSYILDVGMGSEDLSTSYFSQPVAHLAVAHRPGGSGLVDFAPQVLVRD